MGKKLVTCRSNLRAATQLWHQLSPASSRALRELTREYQLSVPAGDLLLLEGRWYVSHTGLLGIARRNHCAGIHVQPVATFCDVSAQRWAFAATVYKSKTCRGFVGYGDADPSNVSFLVQGRRNARGRDTCCQSGPAQGLRDWHLLGRGDWLLCRTRSAFGVEEVASAAEQTGTAAVRQSATDSAQSSASISSIPIWSRLMRPTSAASRPFAMPPATKLKTSSPTWPIGPRKIAMPCSASSTAIPSQKEGAA